MERQIQKAIVELLRRLGWHVVVFSSYRGVNQSIAGWPDVVAFRNEKTLLIECKSERGKLRAAQQRFARAVAPHLGPHLRYIVARSVEDVAHLIIDCAPTAAVTTAHIAE